MESTDRRDDWVSSEHKDTRDLRDPEQVGRELLAQRNGGLLSAEYDRLTALAQAFHG